jgi:hypothetical protein
MNISSELINVISKASPILAGALSTPASSLILSLICKTFGINTSDHSNLVDVIKDDPQATIKLKELENMHEQYIKNLELQQYQLEVQDRDNARRFSLQTHDWVLPIIAIGYSFLFTAMLVLDGLAIFPVKSDIMTDLYSIAMIIVNFYLGSSHGERRAQNKYNNGK